MSPFCMWVPAGASLVMTMEPTCAPSSLGANTTNDREASVVPLSRRLCVKFLFSIRMIDSSTLAAARPLRKCANRETAIIRKSKTDAWRMKVLDLPWVRDVWTIASTTPGRLDVPRSNWAVGFQIRQNGCVPRLSPHRFPTAPEFNSEVIRGLRQKTAPIGRQYGLWLH